MTTPRAEIILYNGTIHTLDPRQPTAEAVGVANGRVTIVGLLEAVEATAHANTRRIDLTGRTLLPGFNDASQQIGKLEAAPSTGTSAGIPNTDFESAILAGARQCLRLGITSVTETGLTPVQLEAYRKLATERRLPLRVNAIARRYGEDGTKIPLPERFESNWLRVDSVRLYTRNAAGQPLSDDQLRAMVWDIHRAGLRAAIYAEGETATEQAISAIEYASGRLVSRLKHRLEPFEEATEGQIRRCREHGISVVVRPNGNRAILRQLLDSGVTVGLGTNAPSSDADPLMAIKATSTHVSIPEALSAYTNGSAGVAGEDHLKGTVSEGKYADFVVLSGDPVRAPADRLTDLQVEMTMLNGQVVYSL